MQSSINERVKILIDSLENGVPARFAKRLGVAASVVTNYLPGSMRKGSPSFDVLQLIAKTYPQINIDWVVTGEGEPFKKGEGINTGISVTKTGTFNTSDSSGNKVSLPNVATPANSTEEKLWQRIKELEEQNKQLVILLMQQATKKE